MKKFNFKTVLGLLSVFSIALFVSCSDDDSKGAGGKPTIESVSMAQNDSLVEQGTANTMYIIRGKGFTGTQKIYFNETDTYFNGTMVTDNVILVTIDRSTPYENANNELKVVTTGGTATYHFVVAPPAPDITGFNPVNAAAGETVTVAGSYFLDPVVTFGTIPATVVSSTLTSIQVKVPEGAQGTYITVKTISGKATSWEAVGSSIYDDNLIAGMTAGGWGVTTDLAATENVSQGEKAIKVAIDSWSGFQLDNGPATGTSTGIRFSIKADTAADIRMILNGDWTDSKQYKFVPSTSWTKVFIPWSAFGGKPATVSSLVFGENKGVKNVYYIDDIGLSYE